MTETAPEAVESVAEPVPERPSFGGVNPARSTDLMRDQRPASSHPVASNVQPGVDLATGEPVVDPAVAARDEAVDRMAGHYEEDGNLEAAERVRARFEEPDTGGTSATTR